MFELLKPSSRHVIKTAQVSGRISIDALFGLRSDQTLGCVSESAMDKQCRPRSLYV